ncbi:MAG: NADH-quinone oxidoreductase subunit J [Phycisphaerales bacterium]|nr:NADH-quinone oxidoreductase subunit J [Phycisphaerales bacterium]
MDQLEPYIACIAGAFALYLLLRPGSSGIKVLGTLLGLGTLAWLVAIINASVPGEIDVAREILFLLFGAITLSAAVRMITHGRPVYSALYFVMVVLSSAGLLLLLEAEFMAFALIIVYAGAILITYMFVLMLAQQASDAEHVEDSPIYDRVSREPGATVVVGLILAGTLVSSALVGLKELPPPVLDSVQLQRQGELLEQLPKQFKAAVLEADPSFQWPPVADDNGRLLLWDRSGAYVLAYVDGSAPRQVHIDLKHLPSNTQHVGWTLVAEFPASLEVAGVILLLAMFGAVVLARRQIEHGEDELRRHVGLEPLHGEDEDAGGAA